MNKVVEKLIAKQIPAESISQYGDDIAKINWQYAENAKPKGKLVLVTAITPTPLGEGKTTVTIGLVDALNHIGEDAVAALREPSLGPVFGRKGGATGGGKTSLHPSDKINLHFTGDFHAITSAHNLIAAMIDQQLFFDLATFDPETITWKRAVDMNERSLRQLEITVKDDISYTGSFQITSSSEIMAIVCLARSFAELEEMLNNIVFAYDYEGTPVKVETLGITEALLALLKDAYSPNAVFTTGGNLAIVHGGPFANIAHGCNSILATKLALAHSDFVITEAGFGSDLGAEKFLDIKVPKLGKKPDAIVLVATIRALKYHAGLSMKHIEVENVHALQQGLTNLQKHIDTMMARGLPLVVALNVFATDTDAEIQCVEDFVTEQGIDFAVSTAFVDGGRGAVELAEKVITKTQETTDYHPLYNKDMPLLDKIAAVVIEVYGATDIEYSSQAVARLEQIKESAKGLPICIAKTPESFTQDQKNRGIPQPFTAKIRDLKLVSGAGMVVVYMGNVIDMPGLPKRPNAVNVTIDEDYNIGGVE